LTIPRNKNAEVGATKHKLYWLLHRELTADDDLDELFNVICRILKGIGDQALSNASYSLPQTVFRTPSRRLTESIRKGPKRTTGKQKTKPVLYYPFSFVKSKKFDNIEPSFRKTFSESAQKISEMISSINPLSVEQANIKLPIFRQSLNDLYALSDDIRESITKDSTSPPPKDILKAVTEIKELLVDPRTTDSSIIDQVIRRVRSTKYLPVPTFHIATEPIPVQ
jgi:hypothetical protein